MGVVFLRLRIKIVGNDIDLLGAQSPETKWGAAVDQLRPPGGVWVDMLLRGRHGLLLSESDIDRKAPRPELRTFVVSMNIEGLEPLPQAVMNDEKNMFWVVQTGIVIKGQFQETVSIKVHYGR
jgi:hypothetical protein